MTPIPQIFDDPNYALTYLTRIAQRRKTTMWLGEALARDLERLAEPASDVAVETGDPIGKVLAERLAREGSVELADRLVRAEAGRRAPRAFSNAVDRLFQEAVTHRRRLAREFPGAFDVDLARSLVNLGKALVAMGRHDEAEPCDQEAVHLLADAVDDGLRERHRLYTPGWGKLEILTLGKDRHGRHFLSPRTTGRSRDPRDYAMGKRWTAHVEL